MHDAFLNSSVSLRYLFFLRGPCMMHPSSVTMHNVCLNNHVSLRFPFFPWDPCMVKTSSGVMSDPYLLSRSLLYQNLALVMDILSWYKVDKFRFSWWTLTLVKDNDNVIAMKYFLSWDRSKPFYLNWSCYLSLWNNVRNSRSSTIGLKQNG